MRLYKSEVLCWRRLLDPEMLGRVSMVQFVRKMKLIGFTHEHGRVDVRAVFAFLDSRCTGYLTLEDWDEVTFRYLMLFRQLCMDEFCTMANAFKHGMDRTGSATVDFATLTEWAEDYEYTGDVTGLFRALDLRSKGYLVVDDIQFLANWDTYSHNSNRFRVSNARRALNHKRKAALAEALNTDRSPRLAAVRMPPVMDAGWAFGKTVENVSRVLGAKRLAPLEYSGAWRRLDFVNRTFESTTE